MTHRIVLVAALMTACGNLEYQPDRLTMVGLPLNEAAVLEEIELVESVTNTEIKQIYLEVVEKSFYSAAGDFVGGTTQGKYITLAAVDSTGAATQVVEKTPLMHELLHIAFPDDHNHERRDVWARWDCKNSIETQLYLHYGVKINNCLPTMAEYLAARSATK